MLSQDVELVEKDQMNKFLQMLEQTDNYWIIKQKSMLSWFDTVWDMEAYHREYLRAKFSGRNRKNIQEDNYITQACKDWGADM